eukprot:363910-Chlamydomonas_euryale.AAC.11
MSAGDSKLGLLPVSLTTTLCHSDSGGCTVQSCNITHTHTLRGAGFTVTTRNRVSQRQRSGATKGPPVLSAARQSQTDRERSHKGCACVERSRPEGIKQGNAQRNAGKTTCARMPCPDGGLILPSQS